MIKGLACVEISDDKYIFLLRYEIRCDNIFLLFCLHIFILIGIKICRSESGDPVKEFEKEIAGRILEEMKKRGMKQTQFISHCAELGIKISQPDISKILSGKKAPNLYQLAAFGRGLGVSTDYLLFGHETVREDFCDPHYSEYLSDGSSGKVGSEYEGTFQLIFISTAQAEDKLLQGILTISKEQRVYVAKLKLDTGEQDFQGERLYKEYSGRFLVSSSMGAAYILLKSEKIGEISMICVRHRNYLLKEVECRLGLFLTASAGDVKEPVAGRVLLFRNTLIDRVDELMNRLRPWLYLTDDVIKIEKDKKIMQEWPDDLMEFKDEFGQILERWQPQCYYELSAEMLRRQLSMNRQQFVSFLGWLYENSEIAANVRITNAEDLKAYEGIRSLKNVKISEGDEGPGRRKGTNLH